MAEQDFTFPEFNMANLEGPRKIIVVGAPKQGKSFFIRDIMYTFAGENPVAKIFSGSETMKPFYKHFVDSHYIVPDYDLKEIKRLLMRQGEIADENPLKSSEDEESNCILVIDDCNKDPKIYKSKEIYEIFQNSRHYRTKTIIAVQHPRFIAKEVAGIADWIVLYKEDNDETVDMLYSTFGGAAKSKTIFRQLMGNLKNHECMVINNGDRSAPNRVFYYKAANRDPNEGAWWSNRKGKTIKFGCKEYREWARVRNNKNWKPNFSKKYA